MSPNQLLTLKVHAAYAIWDSNYSLMSSADTPNVPPNQLLTLKVHASYAVWGSNYTLMSGADAPNVPQQTLNPKGPGLLCNLRLQLQFNVSC